jgi:molecular chaperone GrpE
VPREPATEEPTISAQETGNPGGSAVPAEPPASAIERLEDQLRESQDRFLRLAAEFDNFRKRAARERIELADRSQAALVIRLLEVLDDLDRLAETDPATTGLATLHEALTLVDRKLRKELAAAGLERIDPTGERFDPTLHEAVSVVPALDPALDHRVSAVFQAGYRFKGTLVRPAKVQVYSTEGQP